MRCFLIIFFAMVNLAFSAEEGLPSIDHVVSGDFDLESTENELNINQHSETGIINWHSFSIANDHHVNFEQPSAHSVVLNRVTGNEASIINGQLTANGHLFLVNESGIYIGENGTIDVHGFFPSTLDINNTDFLNSKYHFIQNDSNKAKIVNDGTINSGLSAIIGNFITNNGMIYARKGDFAVLASDNVYLNFDRNSNIFFEISESKFASYIEQNGLIEATNGSVFMASQVTEAILKSVSFSEIEDLSISENGFLTTISHTGETIADNIYLNSRGAVAIGGDLTTNHLGEGLNQIHVFADDILIAQEASIQAQGITSGGEVLIGGGWQGEGDYYQATFVTQSSTSVVDASALVNGDGGTIVLWSDITNPLSSTTVNGSLIAKSGPNGGDGGQIETSGATIDVHNIKLSNAGVNGNNGLWLIDPYNITIDDTYQATIESALDSGSDVTITTFSPESCDEYGTCEDVDFDLGNIYIAGGTSLQKVNDGTSTLTLQAAGSIIFGDITGGEAISLSSIAGPLNLILNSAAGSEDWNEGAVYLNNTSIDTNGGYLLIGGTTDPTTGSAKSVSGKPENIYDERLSYYAGGVEILGSSINTRGGDINIQGYANNESSTAAVVFDGSTILTMGGDLTVTGYSETSSGIGFYENATESDNTFYLSGGTANFYGQTQNLDSEDYVIDIYGDLSFDHGTYNFIAEAMNDANFESSSVPNYGGIYVDQSTMSSSFAQAATDITFKAAGDIYFANNSLSAGSYAINLSLWSDSTNNDDGYIFIDSSNIYSNGGDITIGGGINPLTDAATAVYNSGLVGSSNEAYTSLYNGYHGVFILDSDIQSTGGDVSIRGHSTHQNGRGVLLGSSRYSVNLNTVNTISAYDPDGSGNVTVVGSISMPLLDEIPPGIDTTAPYAGLEILDTEIDGDILNLTGNIVNTHDYSFNMSDSMRGIEIVNNFKIGTYASELNFNANVSNEYDMGTFVIPISFAGCNYALFCISTSLGGTLLTDLNFAISLDSNAYYPNSVIYENTWSYRRFTISGSSSAIMRIYPASSNSTDNIYIGYDTDSDTNYYNRDWMLADVNPEDPGPSIVSSSLLTNASSFYRIELGNSEVAAPVIVNSFYSEPSSVDLDVNYHPDYGYTENDPIITSPNVLASDIEYNYMKGSPFSTNLELSRNLSLGSFTLDNTSVNEDYLGVFSYSSSNETIASVDASSGRVSFLRAGTVEITRNASRLAPYVESNQIITITINDDSSPSSPSSPSTEVETSNSSQIPFFSDSNMNTSATNMSSNVFVNGIGTGENAINSDTSSVIKFGSVSFSNDNSDSSNEGSAAISNSSGNDENNNEEEDDKSEPNSNTI